MKIARVKSDTRGHQVWVGDSDGDTSAKTQWYPHKKTAVDMANRSCNINGWTVKHEEEK